MPRAPPCGHAFRSAGHDRAIIRRNGSAQLLRELGDRGLPAPEWRGTRGHHRPRWPCSRGESRAIQPEPALDDVLGPGILRHVGDGLSFSARCSSPYRREPGIGHICRWTRNVGSSPVALKKVISSVPSSTADQRSSEAPQDGDWGRSHLRDGPAYVAVDAPSSRHGTARGCRAGRDEPRRISAERGYGWRYGAGPRCRRTNGRRLAGSSAGVVGIRWRARHRAPEPAAWHPLSHRHPRARLRRARAPEKRNQERAPDSTIPSA